MKVNNNIVEIFTDGACRGNPGPGGWGAVLLYRHQRKLLSGAELLTTNNRMELLAVINALAALKKPSLLKITTDSQYVRKGITEWILRWRCNGWRTSNKKPIKNIELWQQLATMSNSHNISWHWVKGHSGNPNNELADQLANKAIDNLVNN